MRSTRTAVILTLASTGLLVVVAEDVFRLWIGPDYAGSWLIYACLWGSFWAVFAQMPAYISCSAPATSAAPPRPCWPRPCWRSPSRSWRSAGLTRACSR